MVVRHPGRRRRRRLWKGGPEGRRGSHRGFPGHRGRALDLGGRQGRVPGRHRRPGREDPDRDQEVHPLPVQGAHALQGLLEGDPPGQLRVLEEPDVPVHRLVRQDLLEVPLPLKVALVEGRPAEADRLQLDLPVGLHLALPEVVLLVEDPLGQLRVLIVDARDVRVPEDPLVGHQPPEHLLPPGVEPVRDEADGLQADLLLLRDGPLADPDALLADPRPELPVLGVVEGDVGVPVLPLEAPEALELGVPLEGELVPVKADGPQQELLLAGQVALLEVEALLGDPRPELRVHVDPDRGLVQPPLLHVLEEALVHELPGRVRLAGAAGGALRGALGLRAGRGIRRLRGPGDPRQVARPLGGRRENLMLLLLLLGFYGGRLEDFGGDAVRLDRR
mmetsp:Transcript_6799/g.16693  ORF Transcript_6799/g.16693 Transcript_6799/m.16693 type:complete len:391 (+) Transcript_6799:317-1489(+)